MLICVMPQITDNEVEKFLAFARKSKGLELNGYRKTFVARRLMACLGYTKVRTLDEYINLLAQNPSEWTTFLENLCINVSAFFRDPEVFSTFGKKCLPDLINIARKRQDKTVNIWSCGCSCGEESYSLAILFREYLRKNAIDDCNVRIYATDVDVDALMKARQGLYLKESLSSVSDDILKSYFSFIPASRSFEPDGWQINDRIRQMVSFERHNLITGGVLKNMDVIFIRNVRIYFQGSKAKDILVDIHKVLNDNGYLVLGKIESVGMGLRHLFKTVDAVNRIYKKIS